MLWWLLVTASHHGLLSDSGVVCRLDGWLREADVVARSFSIVCGSDDLLVVDCDRGLQGVARLIRIDVDRESNRQEKIHYSYIDKESANTSKGTTDFFGAPI